MHLITQCSVLAMKSWFLIGCNDHGNLKTVRKQNAEVRGSEDWVSGNQHSSLFLPLAGRVSLSKLTGPSLSVSASGPTTRRALPRNRQNSQSSLKQESRSHQKRTSTRLKSTPTPASAAMCPASSCELGSEPLRPASGDALEWE